VPRVLGVSNGTDALRLALEACGVGPGDEVIVPAFTFIATATAVSALGAKPVLADVDPKTLTLDPASARKVLTKKTKAVVPVHLYGQPADVDALKGLGVRLVEDAAQAHGALYKGRPVGALGDLAAFSFYPSKNLGAAGDAGAISGPASSTALLDACAELRNCGRKPGAPVYEHVRVGHNCRLDELQAAVLRVKLKRLSSWTARRRALAAVYDGGLRGLPLQLPSLGSADGTSPCFHLYVVRTDRRDALAARLKAAGIGSGVYYPKPVHKQPAYAALGGSFPVSEKASREVLALPLYPELSDADAARVVDSVRAFFKD
jgi:dTDP-4-amino-4,6-dideoxygalactose transaminase